MNIGKGRESAVRISLLDVMYGVVLAYGFGFFDQASMTIDYLRTMRGNRSQEGHRYLT